MPCNPLTPDARKVIVRSPLVTSPYTFRWIRPNEQAEGNIGTVDYVKVPGPQAQRLNGAVIHDGTPRIGQNPPMGKWHHVSIAVNGELLIDAELPPPNSPDVVAPAGNLSSLLKARIRLAMGTGRERTFDFDIGAGVEFDVACYAVNLLEVLIPDPTLEVPNAPIAQGSPPAAFQLASVITPTIYFTPQLPEGFRQPLTYTVPTVLSADPNDNFFIPRVAGAIEIEVGVNDTQAAVDGLIVDFLYVPPVVPVATFVAPASFFLLDSVGLAASSRRIPRILIPDTANAFRLRRTFADDDTIVNFIQVLNV